MGILGLNANLLEQLRSTAAIIEQMEPALHFVFVRSSCGPFASGRATRDRCFTLISRLLLHTCFQTALRGPSLTTHPPPPQPGPTAHSLPPTPRGDACLRTWLKTPR